MSKEQFEPIYGAGGMAKMPMLMEGKEVKEARKARIPRKIIGKMSKGLQLTDEEKATVRKRGKAYIPGYVKRVNGSIVTVRSQVRDLPKIKKKKGKR